MTDSLLYEKMVARYAGNTMSRKIITVITAITGDRVVVGEDELEHAIEEHFQMIRNKHKKLKELKP